MRNQETKVTLSWPLANSNDNVSNLILVTILLDVGYESHDILQTLQKYRFSQTLAFRVTSNSVSLLLGK